MDSPQKKKVYQTLLIDIIEIKHNSVLDLRNICEK